MGNNNTCCFRDEKLYGNKNHDPQRAPKGTKKGAESMFNSRKSSNETHDSSQNKVLNGLLYVEEDMD